MLADILELSMIAINCIITIYVYTSLDDNYYQLYYIFGKEISISEKNIKDILLFEFNNNHYHILICHIFGSLYRYSLNENFLQNFHHQLKIYIIAIII